MIGEFEQVEFLEAATSSRCRQTSESALARTRRCLRLAMDNPVGSVMDRENSRTSKAYPGFAPVQLR